MIDGRHAAKTGFVIVENESITNLDGTRHDPFETLVVSPRDHSVEDSLKWIVSPTRASRGRFVFWKDQHTKATDTVNGVVHESTELLSERAEVRIRSERRSIWSAKHSVPITEVSTTSDSIVFQDVIRIGDLGRRRKAVIPDLEQCYLSILTQNAAGVTSSLSKLELDRTKTTRLARKTLPTSTPSSKNIAPPLDWMINRE
jgi:hypothetical protein